MPAYNLERFTSFKGLWYDVNRMARREYNASSRLWLMSPRGSAMPSLIHAESGSSMPGKRFPFCHSGIAI